MHFEHRATRPISATIASAALRIARERLTDMTEKAFQNDRPLPVLLFALTFVTGHRCSELLPLRSCVRREYDRKRRVPGVRHSGCSRIFDRRLVNGFDRLPRRGFGLRQIGEFIRVGSSATPGAGIGHQRVHLGRRGSRDRRLSPRQRCSDALRRDRSARVGYGVAKHNSTTLGGARSDDHGCDPDTYGSRGGFAVGRRQQPTTADTNRRSRHHVRRCIRGCNARAAVQHRSCDWACIPHHWRSGDHCFAVSANHHNATRRIGA
jgi:hypothetical protein